MVGALEGRAANGGSSVGVCGHGEQWEARIDDQKTARRSPAVELLAARAWKEG